MQYLDGQLVSNYLVDDVLERGLARASGGRADREVDVFVGRKLRHLLAQAGLEELHVACEPSPSISGAVHPHQRRLWGEWKLDIDSQIIE